MNKIQKMSKQAIVAAIYVALCMVNPFSFGALQFRIANLLVALPLIKKDYSIGVLLGIAIANMFSTLGVFDVVFGLVAEGAAYAIVVYGCGKNLPFLVKSIIVSFCVSVVIGFELNFACSAPFFVTAAGLFVTTEVSIVVGYYIFVKTPMKKIV